MADPKEVRRLQELAAEMRKKLLYLCGTYEGVVHIGGDLSMTDLLIGLYHYGLNVNPDDIQDPKRDRFILSKGHGAVCMYIAMALRGFFKYEDILETYGKLDSSFGMHVCKVYLKGAECSTGSLGHGLAVATGMAFAARQRKETHRVFCMMGDGETCEGSVWEAVNTAGSYGLGNLVGVVDKNSQMMTTFNGDAINMDPYPDKWRAFNWNTIEIDGHDMTQIVDAIDALPPYDSGKPTVIIASTVKGKGVSFMEKVIGWHAGALSEEDMKKAMAEVDAELERSVS
ncbi:MAG: transketolase [Dehalococcoidales bacterium]|nr:transketolase [Dehalococcoidales bacterium]